jgi:hypothetical protein
MAFQPVPTYQDPVEVDKKTGKFAFNPTWLSWFLTLTNGGLSTTVEHNSLQGLQGGATGQYFHLTQAQLNSIPFRNTGAVSGVTPSGSPFTYTNADTFDEDLIVQGTGVSLVEFGRGASFVNCGVTQGMFRLSIGDSLRVTYTSAPNITKVPR